MALSDAEVVARCPLFAELPDEDVLALAQVGVRRAMRSGETLFLAGEEARGLPLVVRGRVKVFVLSPATGREVVLTVERPYHAVAELVAFDGGPYPASAAALEDGELLWLEQEGFQRLLQSRPGLGLHVVRTLGRRLRRLVGLIERISFQEVIQRLAADLLEASRAGVPFALDTNAAIAARLGTVPELVSRNLSRLHQSGMLELKGRTVLALDQAALRELAEGAGR
ncbi:MAG: Crp/Fnr family transcriptional regulator [Deinococcales bacterium]|jgi:CRP-like cAMP-binding protein